MQPPLRGPRPSWVQKLTPSRKKARRRGAWLVWVAPSPLRPLSRPGVTQGSAAEVSLDVLAGWTWAVKAELQELGGAAQAPLKLCPQNLCP